MKNLIAIVFVIVSFPALAADKCAGVKGVADIEACQLKQSIEEMNCELDKQYQQVMGMYKKINDADSVKRLDKAQQAWTNYRDAVCDFESHAFGDENAIMHARCIARITDIRLDELYEFGDE